MLALLLKEIKSEIKYLYFISFGIFMSHFIIELKIEMILVTIYLLYLTILRLNLYFIELFLLLLLLLTKQYSLILLPVLVVIDYRRFLDIKLENYSLLKFALKYVIVFAIVGYLAFGLIDKWNLQYILGKIPGCKSYGVNWSVSGGPGNLLRFLYVNLPFLLVITLFYNLRKSGFKLFCFLLLLLISLTPLYFQFFNHYLTYFYLVLLGIIIINSDIINTTKGKVNRWVLFLSLILFFKLDLYMLKNISIKIAKKDKFNSELSKLIEDLRSNFQISKDSKVYPEIRDKHIWFYGCFNCASPKYGFHYLDGISKDCFYYCSRDFDVNSYVIARRILYLGKNYSFLGSINYGKSRVWIYKKIR
jgi:hypothetical protein